MRVGIIALLHESNTFLREPTTLDHFRQNLLLTGTAIPAALADSHHEVGGMLEELDAQQIEAVPLLAARAIPYGPISAGAFEELLALMFAQLDRAGPLDGLLVAPHGATVSERHRDADGAWLSALRQRCGSEFPLIGTLDPHANLSAQMVGATDALIAYRTNPHLDQRDRGREAARLMAGRLRGSIHPVQAASFPPLAINIERQNLAEPHWQPLRERAEALRRQPGVLSVSILLGFPYADVAEMGSAAIVVADGDRALARQLAGELGAALWDHRDAFRGKLTGVAEAVQRCRELPGPICLLDMGDNVGGGSGGDGTALARELLRQQVGPACVCLWDPEAVQQAQATGIGGRADFRLGGRVEERQGPPLSAPAEVLGLYGGAFEEPEPRHGGITRFDQGPTAVLRTATDLTVVVTSLRVPPFSLRQLTSCGLEPRHFQVLVAKGVNAPVAAYAPVCTHLLRVNTLGSTCADMTQLPFVQRRRPLYPFEEDAVFTRE